MMKAALALLALGVPSAFASSSSEPGGRYNDQGEWILAGNMESCYDACSNSDVFGDVAAFCSNEQLYYHNDEVSPDAIKDITLFGDDDDALDSLPLDTKLTGMSKAVPNLTPEKLFSSSGDKEWPTGFDCCKLPSIGSDVAYKKRICYCVPETVTEDCAPRAQCMETAELTTSIPDLDESTEFSTCEGGATNDEVCSATCVTKNLRAAVLAGESLVIPFDNSGTSMNELEATSFDEGAGSVWFKISRTVNTNDNLCYTIETSSLNEPDVLFSLYKGKKNKVCPKQGLEFSKLKQYVSPADKLECVDVKPNTWVQVSGASVCGEFKITAHKMVADDSSSEIGRW